MAHTRLDSGAEAGQVPLVADEFRPNEYVRLTIAPDPQRPHAVALVRVFRYSQPDDPEQAAEVEHEAGAVTELRWNTWHAANPQTWTAAAETWMSDWVTARYGRGGAR